MRRAIELVARCRFQLDVVAKRAIFEFGRRVTPPAAFPDAATYISFCRAFVFAFNCIYRSTDLWLTSVWDRRKPPLASARTHRTSPWRSCRSPWS